MYSRCIVLVAAKICEIQTIQDPTCLDCAAFQADSTHTQIPPLNIGILNNTSYFQHLDPWKHSLSVFIMFPVAEYPLDVMQMLSWQEQIGNTLRIVNWEHS